MYGSSSFRLPRLAIVEIFSSHEFSFIAKYFIAAVLLAFGIALFFSLRQAVCCLIAAVADVLFLECSLLLARVLFDFSGQGGAGFGAFVVLCAAALMPFAFPAVWVAAWKYLPKPLPFSLRPIFRRVVGGVFVLAAVLVAGNWGMFRWFS